MIHKGNHWDFNQWNPKYDDNPRARTDSLQMGFLYTPHLLGESNSIPYDQHLERMKEIRDKLLKEEKLRKAAEQKIKELESLMGMNP